MSIWKSGDPLNRPTPDTEKGRASALRRARGLGSSKSGADLWWLQRVTAVALIPLSVWFLAGIIAHLGADSTTTSAWLANPWIAVPLVLFVVVLFQHTRLGLQVILEDYIRSDRLRILLVAAVHAGCYLLMAIGVFSILLIAFR